MAFMAVPASMILVGSTPFFQAMMYIRKQAAAAPKKASKGREGMSVGVTRKTIVATTLAPDETPIMPGSASGFCITA